MIKPFKFTLLERLEPRILLSGDNLLFAATSDSFQETQLDSILQRRVNLRIGRMRDYRSKVYQAVKRLGRVALPFIHPRVQAIVGIIIQIRPGLGRGGVRRHGAVSAQQ